MKVDGAFGYVILVAVASFFVHTWMAVKVGSARRKHSVPYPTMYADEEKNKNAKAFNCVQRAHQNSLENLPNFYILLLLAGVKYPLVAAVFGVIYLLGRIFYFVGYSSGDPKKRMRGQFMYIGVLGLLATSLVHAVNLLLAKYGV